MADTKKPKASTRKLTRTEVHRAYANDLRDRKRLRNRRAQVHAALAQAAVMAKSRKKGTSKNTDKNMETMGFERIADDYNPKALTATYRGGGDVLAKWREVSV